MAGEANVTQSAPVAVKSNAPWILGLIGFILSIPSVFCVLLCATVATGVAAESGDGAMAATGTVFFGLAIAPIVSFVLSFMGKSKNSKITGIILVVISAIFLVLDLIIFSIFGLASSVLFLCSGISSICNASKA